MTRVFLDTGEAVVVSAIEVGPCYVTQVKKQEKDGYDAVQLGYNKCGKVNSPQKGHLKRASGSKELLENLQGAVDENQRLIKITMSRQQEIMRLVMTPSGRRVVNEDVLTCTGEDDDCPIYPVLQLCDNGSLAWNCDL